MICSCCGDSITSEVKGPYNGNQYYCKACWENPNLFFEDKFKPTIEKIFSKNQFDIKDPNIVEVIETFRSNAINPNRNVSEFYKNNYNIKATINVIKLNQKGMSIYVGKVNAIQLLILVSSEQWNESTTNGFQREIFQEKAREIKNYIDQCPIPMIPAFLASFREGRFIPNDGAVGKLELPIIPGLISILDGQQRTAGFEVIFKTFQKIFNEHGFYEDTKLLDKYIELLNFEIPIVFIDSKEIADKLHREESLREIEPMDIERAFFFVINKTQKPVNPSLKDQLAYRTLSVGIKGIPSIEKEKWRTEIVPIANELNKSKGALHDRFNLSGKSGMRKPIPLNAFVTSLRPLFVLNKEFSQLTFQQKSRYLENYWYAVKETFPDSFKPKKKSLLTKSVGVFALNYLASDIFLMCMSQNLDPTKKENTMRYISKLRDFDWDIKSSPIAFLGGKKGVMKAHEVLLSKLELRYLLIQ